MMTTQIAKLLQKFPFEPHRQRLLKEAVDLSGAHLDFWKIARIDCTPVHSKAAKFRRMLDLHRASSAWFPAAEGPRVESSDPFFLVQTFVDNAKSSTAMPKQLYHFIEHCVAIGGVDNAVVLRECLVVDEGLPSDVKVLIGAGKACVSLEDVAARIRSNRGTPR